MNIVYSIRLGSCNLFDFAQRYQSQLEMSFKIRTNTSKRIFNPGGCSWQAPKQQQQREEKLAVFPPACQPFGRGEGEVEGVGLVVQALKWFMDWPKTPSNLWAKLFHVVAVLSVVVLLLFGRIFQLMPAGVGFKCMHTHICSSYRICIVCVSVCVCMCVLCVFGQFSDRFHQFI